MSWEVYKAKNKEKIINFLYKVDKQMVPPISTAKQGIRGVVDLISKEGKIVVGEKGKSIYGISGYTFGEPSKNFENKKVGYIYILVIDPNHKGGTWIRDYSRTIGKLMMNDNIKKTMFKTNKKNIYQNKLFSKFAEKIDEEINDQGVICNVYSCKPSDLYNKYK